MNEENGNVNESNEVVEETANTENETSVETTTETPRKKGIKGLIEYIKSHEDLRQMVLFVLFSMCCAACQTITQFVLKYAIGAFNKEPFSWFIFNYNQEKGLAEFIGFLAGAVVGQVMTFVLNRKKTFKATNNVVVSGIMYAIIAVGIIILQTYLGLVVSSACNNAALKNGTSTEGIFVFLFTVTGMAVGGLVALVLSFLGNKFLVMRDWGKKKKAVETTEQTTEETAE